MKPKFLSRLLPRLNYANVIATIALFVALSGAAVAAGLPKNSVGPRQLKKGSVTAAKIRKQAVTAGKIKPGAVSAGKLGANAVLPENLPRGVVSTAKIANGAVIAESIRNGAVTANKLTNSAVITAKMADANVTTPKLADKAVTPAKLSFETALPGTVSTLRSGQTLRGVFDVGGGGKSTAEGDLAKGAVSYPLPLASAPTVTVLKAGATTANCGGLGTGNSTPAATAGNLCVYLTAPASVNLDETEAELQKLVESSTRLGFGLSAKAKEKEKAFAAIGQWAVTAP